MESRPDFWLIECETYWKHVPSAIACTVLAGPASMFSRGEQWLVRVDPAVTDEGITTDRVVVDRHPPSWEQGDDWYLLCTGVYSLHPAVPEDRRVFTPEDWITSHKITATTRLDMHGI